MFVELSFPSFPYILWNSGFYRICGMCGKSEFIFCWKTKFQWKDVSHIFCGIQVFTEFVEYVKRINSSIGGRQDYSGKMLFIYFVEFWFPQNLWNLGFYRICGKSEFFFCWKTKFQWKDVFYKSCGI